jgi:hypothetical protein
MSMVLNKKVCALEIEVAQLKELIAKMVETQAKSNGHGQPAEPPDLRTREGKAWKNQNSLRS